MCEVDEQLNQLLQEARGKNTNSPTYKLLFHQIMLKMQQSGKISKRRYDLDVDSYHNALLKTWEWLRCNLSDYNPDKGSIYSWFNKTLSFRIMDAEIIRLKQKNSTANPFFDALTGKWINPIELIPAPPKTSDILQEIEAFLDDNKIQLESNHPQNCPQGNCYYLLKHRLPIGETKAWKILAEELESNPKTLNSHYQKKCLKSLKDWLKSQGYEL